ncbi:MAG TPA: carbon monoxide dehydrogenase subunit G [Dermatophilaceae bacterium]
MKISGIAALNAPVEQVWAAFNDPAVLARTLPGCQELREVGPDAYRMTITAGVASIKGTYEGEVALVEQNPPGSFVLRASGAGAPGTVGADVRFSLEESPTGGTDLGYDADAVVGGVIGGVGQRMITGVAKKMAGQFFAAVDADIAGVRVPVAVERAAVAGAGAGSPAGQITYAGAAAGGRRPFQGRDFLYGTLTGAAIALAGVVAGIVAGRR